MSMEKMKKILLIGLVSALLLNIGTFVGQARSSLTPDKVRLDNPPVASFYWFIVFAGYNYTWVLFNASNSTDDYGIVKYEWDWTSDGYYDNTSISEWHRFPFYLCNNVTLRVTDTIGQTATVTHMVYN
jgi:hypothetical protein